MTLLAAKLLGIVKFAPIGAVFRHGSGSSAMMKTKKALKAEEEKMKKTMGMALVAVAIGFAAFADGAAAQDRAWKDCVRRAASAAGVSEGSIAVQRERDTDGGDTYILSWTVRNNDPQRQAGFCEVHSRDVRVVRFETTPYRREFWQRGNGGGYQEPQYTGEYPRVRVDTDGKGYFTSRNFKLNQLDRGFVDTRDQTSVALRGRNGARITLSGVIIASDGREMTMRVTSSDRGNARGRVQIRLNGDRNEVEYISISGYLDNGGEMK